MVKLMGSEGLVSYEHFPILNVSSGELHSGPTAFDAVSIYTFSSKKAATVCHAIPEVEADSAKCMDLDALVVVNTDRRQVFPLKYGGAGDDL